MMCSGFGHLRERGMNMAMSRLWARPLIAAPPERTQLEILPEQHVTLVLQEYAAVRGDVDAALSNQVSILSFGTATVGLLVAAAASLWSLSSIVAILLLVGMAPAVCFLAVAVYLGEQVRQMRAGLFLNHLEETLNRCVGSRLPTAGRLVDFEHWDIRRGPSDIDRYNRRAIVCVFVILAVGFTAAGYIRLLTDPYPVEWVILIAFVDFLLAVVAIAWGRRLCTFIISYRNLYHLND